MPRSLNWNRKLFRVAIVGWKSTALLRIGLRHPTGLSISRSKPTRHRKITGKCSSRYTPLAKCPASCSHV